MHSIALQDTKALEDQEIRRRFSRTAEGAPPQHTNLRFVKYTGYLAAPEWEDLEPGRVFSFAWYLVKSAQSRKDKFETLGYFGADISSAPYTSELTETGEMAQKRKFDKILLVGFRASGAGQSDDRDQPAAIPVDQNRPAAILVDQVDPV